MAECSTCVVTMCRLPVLWSADQMARLSLSVPQLVKMISLAVAPTSAATFSRASIVAIGSSVGAGTAWGLNPGPSSAILIRIRSSRRRQATRICEFLSSLLTLIGSSSP